MTDEEHQTDGVAKQKVRRRPIAAMIEDFSPQWFSICMNAGIISLLLHQLPYQFHDIRVLSTIGFLIDLTLLVVFSALMILRFILYPQSALKASAGSAEELGFYATIPISLLTIAELVGLIVSNAYWGGHAWSLVAYVLWWTATGMMVLATLVIYITIFRALRVNDRIAPTALFIPAVGTATVATAGGLICQYSYGLSARLCVPVIIVSYILVGQGMFLVILLYIIFLHRLMSEGWPEGPKTPSLILLLGPCGQSATAFQLLGTAANSGYKFGGYHKGTFLQAMPAAALNAASIMISSFV